MITVTQFNFHLIQCQDKDEGFMGLARVGAVQMRGNKTSLDLAIGDTGFYLFLRSGVSGGVSFFLALLVPHFFGGGCCCTSVGH